MPNDDDVGAPIWGRPAPAPNKPPERAILTLEEIAREAGVPAAAMDRAVAFLVAQGNLALVLSPLCLQCGHMMGQYAHANDIPEEVACEECGQGYHISELDIRVAYEVVKAPTEESPGS